MGSRIAPTPRPILSMSLQPAIPWRVALQQSPPPLRRLSTTLKEQLRREKTITLNSNCAIGRLSHSRGSPHQCAGAVLFNRRELIQNGFLIAAGCVARPSLFAATSENEDPASAAEPLNTWTIGNDSIRRTIAFVPGTGLLTRQLSDLGTQAEFILPGDSRWRMGQEFSFRCNDQNCAGTSAVFDLLSAAESALPTEISSRSACVTGV